MLVTGGAGFIGSNLAEAKEYPESSEYGYTPSLPNIENMPAEDIKRWQNGDFLRQLYFE